MLARILVVYSICSLQKYILHLVSLITNYLCFIPVLFISQINHYHTILTTFTVSPHYQLLSKYLYSIKQCHLISILSNTFTVSQYYQTLSLYLHTIKHFQRISTLSNILTASLHTKNTFTA